MAAGRTSAGARTCCQACRLRQTDIRPDLQSFVPADAATIGLTDKSASLPKLRWTQADLDAGGYSAVFTRLTAKESVSKLQSSFTIDLNQISQALRNCTARSLLIIDEFVFSCSLASVRSGCPTNQMRVRFGKGTISSDGAGLLAGTILHLLNRGKECPKAIVMTHFQCVRAPYIAKLTTH